MATIPTPKTQGLQCSTFTQPPLDGSLSIPALYDWQAINSSNHPLFVFEETPGFQRTILWAEAMKGIQRATKIVREAVDPSLQTNAGDKPPVVAVLASSDTITYFAFIVGALRSGCTLFPLSVRNSVAATTFLLENTGVSHLFVSSDQSMRTLAEAALKNLSSENLVKKHAMPVFEDLFPVEGMESDTGVEPLAEIKMDKAALILHSSGTTAFPKPIYLTHRSLVESASVACFGDTDLAGATIAGHSLPMFHGLGMLLVLIAVSSGIAVSTFKPQSPHVVPNPTNTFEGAIATKSDYILVAPTFIETWSHDLKVVQALASTKGIIYGGGPLTKEAGDIFASHGVNIFNEYASTQTMLISNFLPTHTVEPVGMDWEYFTVSPARDVDFIDMGNNEFELIVISSDFYRPSVINTEVNGRDAFATSDLVSPHPRKRGLWKVVGRTDDQIMHSTGEKTNPGPLEGMLMRDPFISGVIIFGRGRFYCGVLVQPKEPFAFDPSDTKKLAEFRNLIWPTVERVNSFAPTHSHIFKEMIIVTSPEKPFSYTAKGTIRRQAVIREYEAEIDAAYMAVEESSQEDIIAPSDWSLPNTKDFIREVVQRTMKKEDSVLSDATDLFEMGLDSLQVTWIRNSILRALRSFYPAIVRRLPQTFVYDHPSILRLSEYLSASVTGTAILPENDTESKRRELRALVDKYTKDFPSFKSTGEGKDSAGSVVLLTGGTGSLGSNILAKLIQNDAIKLIYAMSRPSSSGATSKERHSAAFQREGIDVKVLDENKVRFLEGDAEREDFSVDHALYEEMRSSVTHIIHNAWRVNFNVAVTSFESNIRSVRNFVDFALGTRHSRPPRILFISSVGVFQNLYEKKFAPEEHLAQPDTALGTGYGESKWVSEQILLRASQQTPVSTTVIRCGQMTGGFSGAWNDHEWFPSLIKSSITLRNLPDMSGVVSWVTAYDAAGAIVDMLDAQDSVLNLAHPKPTSWSSIIAAFAKVLKLTSIPYSEWLDALDVARAALENVSDNTAEVENAFRENPALRLVDFFKAGQKQSDNPYAEPVGICRMDNKKAVETSQSLKNAELIGPEHVERWVSYWRRTGFLP